MRVVALDAIRVAEWLAVVRLDQARVFRVVAVEAERRGSFRQMIIKFDFAALAGLMRYMAGLATHIEGCMAAAVLWNIHTFVMAAQAEVLVLSSAAGRLEQLVLVWRGMRIMTLDAITNGWWMDLSVNLGGVLIGVASDA